MAYIQAVCLSHKKGIVKKEQAQVIAKENWGIEGDAHAGEWHRQVFLLAGESIDSVRDVLCLASKTVFLLRTSLLGAWI
jgi:hypothetical protein